MPAPPAPLALAARRFNRVLHDPSLPPRDSLTTEQYSDKAAASRSTTLHHFPEKLLKLKVGCCAGLLRVAQLQARPACRPAGRGPGCMRRAGWGAGKRPLS